MSAICAIRLFVLRASVILSFFFVPSPQTIRYSDDSVSRARAQDSVQVRSSQQLKRDMTPAKEERHSLSHADIGHLGNQEKLRGCALTGARAEVRRRLAIGISIGEIIECTSFDDNEEDWDDEVCLASCPVPDFLNTYTTL
jgi:hypothetical protein